MLYAAPVTLDSGLGGARYACALAQSPPSTTIEGEIAAPDIAQAIDGITRLSEFFATLARNDPNRYAAALWRSQQNAYAAISRRLSGLSAQGRVRVAPLREGRASRIDGGAIVVDRRLGGLWPPELVAAARRGGDGDWRYISRLSTVLLRELLHLEPATAQDWFRDHLTRSTLGKAPPKGERPRIAGFWHIKDKYLWISMLAAATPDPEQRRALDSRRIDLSSEAQSAAAALDRDLGAGWSRTLRADWQEYGRQVGRFSSNRNWLTAEDRPPAKQAAAVPPEDSAETPLPKPKPDELRRTAPAAAASAAPEDDRIARLSAELEETQADARRREAQLTAALETARREAAELETKLDANNRSVARVQEALDHERTARRQEVESLQGLLAAQQEASRQEAARLTQSFTTELEASRQDAADLREQLAAAGENSRQDLTKLQGDLEAARQADLEAAARTEERLTAELEASGEELALVQQQLTAARESSRQDLTKLQGEFAAARQADLEAAARTEERLTAELEASREELALVQQQLAATRESSRQELTKLQGEFAAARQANLEAARTEEQLAAALEGSREELALVRQQLTAARASSQQELTKLQGEFAAARQANLEAAARTEEQLAAELEASRQKLALVQQQLTTEMEDDRKAADRRQAQLAAELERGRQQTAETAARLSAELAASRDEAMQLRRQLAELTAARAADEGSGTARWMLVILATLLGLAGVSAAVALRRRRAPSPVAQTAPVAREHLDSEMEPSSGPEERVTPQLIVETLRRGDLPLFEQRFAKLAGLRTDQLRRIVTGGGGENLAIVCRALGIDKLTFASIFLLSQTARSPEDKGRPHELSRVTAYYDQVADESAREVLRQWQGDPSLPGVIGRPRTAAQ